jgi:hypothetical protein
LACSISNNEEGVKLVRMSASQLEALCPQVKYSWQVDGITKLVFCRMDMSIKFGGFLKDFKYKS